MPHHQYSPMDPSERPSLQHLQRYTATAQKFADQSAAFNSDALMQLANRIIDNILSHADKTKGMLHKQPITINGSISDPALFDLLLTILPDRLAKQHLRLSNVPTLANGQVTITIVSDIDGK